MADEEHDPLGWHVICGTDLLDAMRRCEHGETADLVYAEMWANADHEDVKRPTQAEAALAHVRGFVSCLLAEPTRQTLRVIDKLAQRGLARLGDGRTS